MPRLKKLKFRLLHDDATLPTYATDGSAGLDLYSAEDKPVYCRFGEEPVPIRTGLSVEIPKGYVGLIKSRSGMAFKDGVFGFDGVIDSDYRGEIRVLLRSNRGRHTQCYRQGDRIAQLVIVPCPKFQLVSVCSLTGTERDVDGFGSTGK